MLTMQDKGQASYLKPLIVRGKLKYTIPDMPKHPDQAYIVY